MTSSRINPFNELYVTETVSPQDFVRLFSPALVEDCLPVFQPGNVVVRGVQGSGKSMLLTLLKPEVRIAYFSANEPMPLPSTLSKFISCGINFTRSAAIDFGQRATDTDQGVDVARLPLYFGDFVNYWVVDDLLRSIDTLRTACKGGVGESLGLKADQDRRDAAAQLVSRDSCWCGSLSEVRTYEGLRQALQSRIADYRRFLHFGTLQLPPHIKDTVTAIGEPISTTTECLREAGVIPREVSVFVRIDQYEELTRLENWSKTLGLQYRRVINKALGLRDPRISYRIGARRYAWQEDVQLYGTTSVLELERDYKLVDIDDILRRKENRKTWVFPRLAADVFQRRLAHAGYATKGDCLKKVFSRGMTPEEVAKRYAKTSGDRAIDTEESWSDKTREDLLAIAKDRPFDGKLSEAWLRQRHKDQTRVIDGWMTRMYWRKERVQQALMQIAARCGQRMIWAGVEDVLALSGGNILVFLSLCQHIWGAWLRSVRGEELSEAGNELPTIAPTVQAVGIQSASIQWFEKIAEEFGKSRERQLFVKYVGRLFRQQLLDDHAMSYPGHNGFSLREDELRDDQVLYRFLEDAVDYGDLYDSQHTTRLDDGKARKKWYLNPILSPFFQIPDTHVKEPKYVTVEEVRKWLSEAGIGVQSSSTSSQPKKERADGTVQPDLFESAPLGKGAE